MKMFAFMGGNLIGKIKSYVKLFSVLVSEKSVAIAIRFKVHTTENLKQIRYYNYCTLSVWERTSTSRHKIILD